MMSFSQKKIIFCLGIILIILTIFIWLIILPLMDKIKITSQEYLTNQNILVGLDQGESLFKELEKNYQKKNNDLSKIEGVFLGYEETAGFISTLEEVAQETGNSFEIKSVSVSPLDKEDPFIILRIFLQGNFTNLLSFLASVEDSPYSPYRLVEIGSLNIRKLDVDLADNDLESVLNIKIFTK